MILVRQPLASTPASGRRITIPASRWELAKLRWRTSAEDGLDFGFDLQQPLQDGAPVHAQEGRWYVLAQTPEPVLRVDPGSDRAQWARTGWNLGNLHQPVEITEQGLRVADDPATRRCLTDLGLRFQPEVAVFRPSRGTLAHGPTHAHH